MAVMDLFWLFFIFSALQPVLRRRISTRCARARSRRSRRSAAVAGDPARASAGDDEPARLPAGPLYRHQRLEEVLRAIQLTDDEVPLDLVLHTPGGLVLAATADRPGHPGAQGQGDGLRAALRHVGRHADCAGGRRDRDVPHCGARAGRSAARQLAGRLADQGRGAEADRRDRRRDAGHGRRRPQGDRPGRGDGASCCLAKRLPEQAEALADKLSTGTWTHDYPITADEAKALGLPVEHRHAERGAGADDALPAAGAPRRRRRRVPAGAAAAVTKRPAERRAAYTGREAAHAGIVAGPIEEARTRWKLLTFYEKFEHACILILTGLIAIDHCARGLEPGAEDPGQHLSEHASIPPTTPCFRPCSA